MCGIAGYVGKRPLPEDRVTATLEALRHRGPDARGWRSFQRPDGAYVYLLHTRLKILDLDPRSDQPFRLGDKWLVFNGELYNYVELRSDLQRLGRTFRTTSDTEVLATVLDQYGVDGLDRCEGMWAFAVYDERTGDLSLSRDRFGEKTIHCFEDDAGTYFASEVTSLRALGVPVEVDETHLCRFLVNGYKALNKGGDGFFRRIAELPAASVREISPGQSPRTKRYWALRYVPDEALSYDDAVAEVRARVIETVALRLRADVPLAFCMSGGVDSNTLIAVAKRVHGHDVHGFTIVEEDERYAESDIVSAVVDELQIRHTPIPTETTEFLPRLRQLVRHHGAPVATISYYAHWLLMRAVHQHGYKISVSGTAADELLTGYYDHHLAYLSVVQNDPERHAAYLAAWQAHVMPVVRNPFLRDPDLFVRAPDFRDHIYLKAEEFAGWLQAPFAEPFREEAYTTDVLRNRMMNELFHEAVPVILKEDDLNAMYYSIENRSPFLDRRLVETCYRIPSRHLMRDGYAKAILRDAMRGIVPDVVLDSRRKVGFNAPIESFLDLRSPGVRAEVLDSSPVYDVVRRSAIEAVLAMEHHPNSVSKFLFSFLGVKMFLEEIVR